MNTNFKIKNFIICIIAALALLIPAAKPALAVDQAQLWAQINALKRQILLLQIELVKTQIADLQRQLEQLLASAFIDVIYPAGGESLVNGKNYYIRWESKGVDKVAIELVAPDNGTIIADSVTASNGSYYWLAENVSGSNFRIKIFDRSRPEIYARSGIFAIKSRYDVCSDGTWRGQCSTTLPKYCTSNGALVDKCSQCGCPSWQICDNNDGVCRSPLSCSDGTPSGQCSAALPKYCYNGVLSDNCSLCGCNPDEGSACSYNGTCQGISSCSDGTLGGRCALNNKPKYCKNGALIYNCAVCGCPTDGSVCSANGTCQGADACSDGTVVGYCSSVKPKLCFDKELGLVDACHSCGCPAGLACGDDSKCH